MSAEGIVTRPLLEHLASKEWGSINEYSTKAILDMLGRGVREATAIGYWGISEDTWRAKLHEDAELNSAVEKAKQFYGYWEPGKGEPREPGQKVFLGVCESVGAVLCDDGEAIRIARIEDGHYVVGPNQDDKWYRLPMENFKKRDRSSLN